MLVKGACHIDLVSNNKLHQTTRLELNENVYRDICYIVGLSLDPLVDCVLGVELNSPWWWDHKFAVKECVELYRFCQKLSIVKVQDRHRVNILIGWSSVFLLQGWFPYKG